ncbi:synaptonemal complex protein 1-like [Xenia sp. Carnegie-2017]|uniref:synaptonemal complex protein 1-like n=1 Tax=Xenia sp. Carnegie-2017 TaxID=2897299 RepID=UPI001F04D2A5|nr:synaptonemal complex protein 1-like [Xenia sp. Carnegie-2017]
MDLKDKTKKLIDANFTIESQRKSILELQFQNEKLSTKLQEEIAGQVELEHKATATRELSKVLKDQVLRIDEAVVAGEQDREELRYSEKQRLEQFQELVVKFQELEIQHSTKYNEMKDKLQKQHEKHSAYMVEIVQDIQDKEKEIKVLSEEKAEKDLKISELVKDLGENREHLEATKGEEAALKDKLKKSDSIITSQDINLKSVNEMLTYAQNENKNLMSDILKKEEMFTKLEEENVKLQNVLHEEETKHNQASEASQERIAQLICDIDEQKSRIKEQQEKLESLTDELNRRKKDSDGFKAEEDRLVKEIEDIKESNAKLTLHQEDLIKCVRELEDEKNSLQQKNTNLIEKDNELKVTHLFQNNWVFCTP